MGFIVHNDLGRFLIICLSGNVITVYVNDTMIKNKSLYGFSLISLLAVITIIGILMSMLFPAIHLVRARADTTVCLLHLRQVSAAYVGYAAEWRDLVVSSSQVDPGSWNSTKGSWTDTPSWYELVGPYVDSGLRTGKNYSSSSALRSTGSVTWGCRAWLREKSRAFSITTNPNWEIGYGYNYNPRADKPLLRTTNSDFGSYYNNTLRLAAPHLQTTPWIAPHLREIRFGDVTNPAQRPMLLDSQHNHIVLTNLANAHLPGWKPMWRGDTVRTRHHGRANALFFDGHGGAMTAADSAWATFAPSTSP
jgi:prepilin-type processing-associated H-X9-DG protein